MIKLKRSAFYLSALAAGMLQVACTSDGDNTSDMRQQSAAVVQAAAPDMNALKNAVSARSEDEQARDSARHPAQTLAFFRVAPGMRVAEALPGGGWYSKILAPYLGANGALYAANYNDDMWEMFGFFSPEAIAERVANNAKFPAKVAEMTDNNIETGTFTFATLPDELAGSFDRVLFVRALHNLNRFEDKAGTMSQALAATHKMLKKGGMVGVVQHRLPESAAAEGADGSRGYLKQSDVIAAFNKAGFELMAESEINANSKDQPGAKDIVWRLPPSLATSREDAALREQMQAIGESDRMTLLFKKQG